MAPRRYLGRSLLGAAGTWVRSDPFEALLGPLEVGPPVPVGVSVECSDALPPQLRLRARKSHLVSRQPAPGEMRPPGTGISLEAQTHGKPAPEFSSPRGKVREAPHHPASGRGECQDAWGLLGALFTRLGTSFSCKRWRRPVASVGSRSVSLTVSPPLSRQPAATNIVSMLILVGQLAGSWLALADFTPGPPGCPALVQTKLRRIAGDASNTAKT